MTNTQRLHGESARTDDTLDDAQLVARSRAGNRTAFAVIVGRYQTLVCSINYSVTGSLSQSEDLAQETFLTAWRQLADLREPARLRAWLCGIARNLSRSAIRRSGREPTSRGEPLAELPDAAAALPLPLPAEQAISRQEQAILWRSLERIPDSYREPLVLFYREDQSIEGVAAALELSPELVKQRLSRGRKLLQEQVLAFVEGALQRSRPGKALTIAVLAALPALAASTAAAGVGLTATKGTLAAKVGAAAGLFNLVLGPLVALLGGYFGARAGIDSARTAGERRVVVRNTRILVLGSMLFTLLMVSFILSGRFWIAHPVPFAVLGVGIPLGFAAWLLVMMVRFVREARSQFAAEQGRQPDKSTKPEPSGGAAPFAYRSRATLFGLPLLHIHYGSGARTPAVGWIAVGDRAIGVLFALGGVAAGGICVGTISLGLVSVGTISAGLLSMGGVTAGLLAVGGAALGLVAVGGFTVGWSYAQGGLALAHDFAVGTLAMAEHANDGPAAAFYAAHHLGAAVLLLSALAVLPTAWLAGHARRQARRRRAGS